MATPYNPGTNLCATMKVDSSNFPTAWARESDEKNYVLSAEGTLEPVANLTDANVFQVGCVYNYLSAPAGTNPLYTNVGTAASPSWKQQGQQATNFTSATIATTGNTDYYILAPSAGSLASVDFNGVDVLATSDSNYITWTVTNLGQAGAGSTAMLAATAANTTKATGGSALAANTKRALTLNATAANLVVAAGDLIRVRAAATGTLANTVTIPRYIMRFV